VTAFGKSSRRESSVDTHPGQAQNCGGGQNRVMRKLAEALAAHRSAREGREVRIEEMVD
jgi:hypothetical protein